MSNLVRFIGAMLDIGAEVEVLFNYKKETDMYMSELAFFPSDRITTLFAKLHALPQDVKAFEYDIAGEKKIEITIG